MGDSALLRVIDANLNRASEGIRVLEEVARFLLNDEGVTTELKALRHKVMAGSPGRTALLSARGADTDVGAFLEEAVPGESAREDVVGLIAANAKRVQEALRVLEEFCKLADLPVAPYKEARFSAYELEKALLSSVTRRAKRELVRGLYVIVDPDLSRGRSDLEVARQAIAGGARLIQLRDKKRDKGELLPVARELQHLCTQAGVLFIVNDDVDLALAAGADGVHVGQKDLPVKAVRAMLPLDKIAGCSTNNPEEARQAQADGADYVAVGAIFPTGSKTNTRPAGLDTIRQVRSAVSLPVVAIGGINEGNIALVVEAGADSAAVISTVVSADDVAAAARSLAAKIVF